jgi:thymidylate synthase
MEHAELWKLIQNKDKSFNSNYGQYFFGKENQFDTVVQILRNDKDSRRASVILLTKDHLKSDTNDIPCTYVVGFRIREDKLNMTVHTRSQDAILGMGNDAPAFSFVHEMLLNSLKEFYPQLDLGTCVNFVDSFHVYEKHFKMAEDIVEGDYDEVDCPKISGPEEVKYLRILDFKSIPEEYKFTKWLMQK